MTCPCGIRIATPSAGMNTNRQGDKAMSEDARSCKNRNILKSHPCFSKEAHTRFGRIHLPVAPACNIQCRYCIRKYDCANESRPGITSRVMTPYEALDRVR